MRDELLHKVMLPNGTFKTTGRHRLDDLNAFSLPFIRQLPGHLRIMDVAASSGSTTEEWSAQLTRAGVSFDITATDKEPFAYQLHIAPGIKALVDRTRSPLHFSIFGRGVSPRLKGAYAPVKWVLVSLLRVNRQPLAAKVPIFGDLPVLEDDLLAPNPPEWLSAFDVVRAANILNRAYFCDSGLRSIVAILRQRVKPNGLLIISRTRETDGKNEASIFRESTLVAQLNSGSEITELLQPAKS